MSQSTIPQRLKRVKAIIPISRQNRSGKESKTTNDFHPRNKKPAIPTKVDRMLRILLGNPWDDYDYIRHLGQIMLARRKISYFKLVNIQQCHSFKVLEHSQVLSSIQHPNVAAIYDVYCNQGESFLVTEHLDISISQLKFQRYELEEWEIATILLEVPAIYHIMVP